MTRRVLKMILNNVRTGGLRCDNTLGELMRTLSDMSEDDFLRLIELCGSDIATIGALCNLRSVGHYAHNFEYLKYHK